MSAASVRGRKRLVGTVYTDAATCGQVLGHGVILLRSLGRREPSDPERADGRIELAVEHVRSDRVGRHRREQDAVTVVAVA